MQIAMKKALSVVAVVLMLVLAAAFLYFRGKRYEVVIPQEKIDAALAERFPASKKYPLVLRINYSNPEVTLLEDDDRVRVGLDATLNLRLDDLSEELGGGATVTAGIRYDNETQEFFLDDAEFARLEIQGIPEEWLEKVTDFASEMAKELLTTMPVYRLEAKDVQTGLAKLLLKDFDVREQEIHVTLGI